MTPASDAELAGVAARGDSMCDPEGGGSCVDPGPPDSRCPITADPLDCMGEYCAIITEAPKNNGKCWDADWTTTHCVMSGTSYCYKYRDGDCQYWYFGFPPSCECNLRDIPEQTIGTR